MLYVLLDTSVYIALARGSFPEIIDQISERIELEELVLFTNEIIQDEWNRHKKDTVDAIVKRIKSETNSAKRLSYFLSEKTKKPFEEAIKEYQSNEKFQIDSANTIIEKIEYLIYKKAVKLTITDEVKLKIIGFALDKKAPFHHKSSSVADALILFSYIDFLKKDDKRSASYFVTTNPDDFSLSTKEGEKNTIHPDLAPYIDEVKLKYTTDLQDIIKLSDEITKSFDEYLNQQIDDWIYYQIELDRGK